MNLMALLRHLVLPLGALVFLAWAAYMGWVPLIVFKAYLAASVVSFAVYAIDKGAAARGQRRVNERHLLALDMACGWPGGAVAQFLLHHKTRKARYQLQFWLVVLINVAILYAFLRFFGALAQ